MVKILQFNCQSLTPNKDKISHYLNNNNIDIAILSEIFKHNDSTRIPNYYITTKTRQDGFGGVAVLLKNDIKSIKLKYNTNQDILIVETTN